MNKNTGCEGQGGIAAAGRRERKTRRARDLDAARRGVTHRAVGGGSLTAEAERLLGVLSRPGAEAMPDPGDSASVLVRATHRGVSVGAGRFRAAAAEALERHDLARWSRPPGPSMLRITGAGEAHHRRREAGEDPFKSQHGAIVDATVATESGPARVRVDAEESPLDWLRRRRDRDGSPLIDAASYEAGERLRRDITLAGLLPGVTARWDEPKGGGPGGPADATDRMVAARQRLRHAFEAVGGDFSDLLLDLCGFLKGIETIERERGWPARSAKVVIRLALARLAEHYGLESSATGPRASRGIRAWQAVVIEGGRA